MAPENQTHYSLEFTELFVSQFRKLSKTDQGKAYKAIGRLKENPFRHKPLKGPFSGCFRLRVGGLRVVYMPIENEKTVYLIDVDFRKKVYRRDIQTIIDQISGGTLLRR